MQQIEVLDLIIKPSEYSVFRQGKAINLPKLSFELLHYLAENKGEICNLEQICKGVWKNTIVSNDTVIQRVTLLRKSLGDDPKQPKYIESIRGRGYRLLTGSTSQKPDHKKRNTTVIFLSLTLLLSAVFWLQKNDSVDAPNVAMKPDNPLIARGQYYLSVGQRENIERAIDLFRQALNDSPNLSQAQIGLSFALSRSVCRYGASLARAQEANQLASTVVNLDETNGLAQHALAYSWDCLGNLELALEHYLLASERATNNDRVISSAAHLYETKGQLLDAYKLNMQAKALQPDKPLADLQIARIFELLKFTTQAEAAYQKLFVLYPDNVFINEALPRFLFFQGRYSEAKQAFEKALARKISRNDILLNYATLTWMLEGQAAALPWFQKAADSSPNYSFATTVTQVLQGAMSTTQAEQKIAEIQSLVAAGNTWPYHYIEASVIALWILNDKQLAIAFLEKSVELGYLNSEYLTISPLFSSLSAVPEFYQIIDNINQKRESMHQLFLAQYSAPQL